MRFVWARTTLPPSQEEFQQKFKIQTSNGDLNIVDQDKYLPRAHTCFFSLNLPRYSSFDIMALRLRYAINNCVEMDADFRLTDSEMTGWDLE